MTMLLRQKPPSRALNRLQHHRKGSWGLRLALGLLLGVGCKVFWPAAAPPQALFVLGGHEERELFAAQFAKKHPQLSVWVSSGSPEHYVKDIFEKAGIEGDRLYLDYGATDTVTNFTTLVDDLRAKNITSVYLITSESHMQRAKIVADLVFKTHGIQVEPVAVPSALPEEPVGKSVRDGLRAMIWLVTGYSFDLSDLQDLK